MRFSILKKLYNKFILKYLQREQLRDHEERVNKLETELDEHRRHPPERGTKSLMFQNYKEKDVYLHYEVNYVFIKSNVLLID
jgi:hypothetical protein